MLVVSLVAGSLWSGECGISQHANFDQIYLSVLTLFRLATGDAWACLFLDAQKRLESLTTWAAGMADQDLAREIAEAAMMQDVNAGVTAAAAKLGKRVDEVPAVSP